MTYIDSMLACCYAGIVNMTKTTFYLSPTVQKALKRRALEADTTISAYIESAVSQAIAEDLEDLEEIKARSGGATETLDEFLTALKADGLL